MRRIHVAVLIALALIGFTASNGTAQDCDRCDTHYGFCWGCHDHCFLAGAAYTNSQNHSESCSADYPYSCDTDHLPCDPELPSILDLAVKFDRLVASQATDREIAAFVVKTMAEGVNWQVNRTGVRLEVYCSLAKRERGITVPTERNRVVGEVIRAAHALYGPLAIQEALY